MAACFYLPHRLERFGTLEKVIYASVQSCVGGGIEFEYRSPSLNVDFREVDVEYGELGRKTEIVYQLVGIGDALPLCRREIGRILQFVSEGNGEIAQHAQHLGGGACMVDVGRYVAYEE